MSCTVEGIITPQESVSKMIEVIQSKGIQHSGTFWTYENKVREKLVYMAAHLRLIPYQIAFYHFTYVLC